MKITIIICTYNPDSEIIGKLYRAISELVWPEGVQKEILLIDNASNVPLAGREDVREWQSATDGIRVIREENPGLSNARMRGFREASGDWLIFFDDDNVPERKYVKTVTEIEKKYPFVGVWGPGVVDLEWMPGGNPEVQKQFAHVYQKHEQHEVTYALDFVSPSTMPYGTGMVLRREVADAYINWYTQKDRKTTGRIGKSLTSYEDVQICWLGMETGWAVGRHPGLKLTHVIAGEKTEWNYLARLLFGIHSSYAPALKEALPHRYPGGIPVAHRLAGFLAYHTIAWATKKNTPPLNVYLAKHLGQPVGAWKAAGKEPPAWIQKLIKRFYE